MFYKLKLNQINVILMYLTLVSKLRETKGRQTSANGKSTIFIKKLTISQFFLSTVNGII